jgi:hypothetical protein
MSLICLAVIACGAMAPAPAQNSTPSTDALTTEAKAVLATVHGLAPPIAAYFLLLEVEGVVDKHQELLLLEEILTFVRFAPETSGRYIGPPLETRELFLLAGAVVPLDRLTLSLLAIDNIAKIDPGRALTRLEELQFPKVPSMTCADFVALDLGPSYLTLAETLNRVAGKNRAYAERANHLVDRLVEGSTSSVQIAAIAELLDKLDLSDEEASCTLNVFASKLESTKDLDPAFSAAKFNYQLPMYMHRVIAKWKARSLPVEQLLQAYRVYLVANQKERCAYLLYKDNLNKVIPSQDYIALFNRDLAGVATNRVGRLVPIQSIERSFANPPPIAEETLLFSSPEAQSLEEEVFGLLRSGDESASQPSVVPAEAMESKVVDLLRRIDVYDRKPGGDKRSVENRFLEALHLLATLSDACEQTSTMQKVSESFARVLGRAWNDRVDSITIYLFLRGYMIRPGPKPLQQARMDGIDAGLTGQSSDLGRLPPLISRWEQPK